MTALPAEFADLEDLASCWALPTRRERQAKRARSGADDLSAFYARTLARLPAALQYLDRRPLSNLSPAEARLLDLMLALAEVGPTIEFYGGQTTLDGADVERMRTAD
jgi:hypothetical protein